MNSKKDIIDKINKEGSVNMDLRKKFPKRAIQTDYGNGRSAAIELNCFQCMGGDSDCRSLIKNCQSYDCFFWRYRPGGTKGQQPPIVLPTKEWYQKKVDASVSDAKREHGRKMGLKRNVQND